MARVEITTAGHTIVIEADADVNALADKALSLWRETRTAGLDHADGAIGFTTELANPDDRDLSAGFARQ